MCTFAFVMKRILIAIYIISSFFAISAQNVDNSQTLSANSEDAVISDKVEKSSYAWTII